MPALYSLDNVDPRAFDLYEPANIVGTLGCLMWVPAYAAIIHKSFKDRAYGIPLVSICLNFTWELIASFLIPDPGVLWRSVYRAWLVVDVIIVWQLFRHGRELQTEPLIRKYFHPIVAATLVAAFAGQYTFIAAYHDRQGVVTGMIINLIMSVLFVFMYLGRREHRRGISVLAAWLKMIGTLLVTIQVHALVPWLNPELETTSFLTFLGVTIFLFDGLYVWLVSTGARELNPARARGWRG